MRPECIIVDFDGTFTDVERESIPFLAAYRRGLEGLLGEPLGGRWDEAVATVQRDPHAHGFHYGDKIVAPAHADPYILATSVAMILLDGVELRNGALERLYRGAYASSSTVFRPDARAVLDALIALGSPVFVVTNSDTEQVRAKVEALAPDALKSIEVFGDAKKFHIEEPNPPDARFDALPETMQVPGLSRMVYLRRGRYYEVLRNIWNDCGAAPSTTLVCGDIFELDLALPAALGARVHHVGRASTPAYERDAVRAAGGTFALELSSLLTVLEI